ncbi:MAG: B12-binding domain-containing protein [Acidobacteriota bacterium]
MKTSLSPRDLAHAIGVSESSIKRWTDDGLIEATRTAGGHRRIPIPEAIRFIRQTGTEVARPQLLGLEELPTASAANGDEPVDDQLFHYLYSGQANQAKGQLVSLYLEGQSIAQIIDGPVKRAMDRIGELWQHAETGVYVEHRATEIITQGIHLLRSLLPEPSSDAMAAIGGTPSGDPYMIPSLAVATLLKAAGFQAINLGPDTPASALIEAVKDVDPKLVWISISFFEEDQHVTRELAILNQELAARGTLLLIGGAKSDRITLPTAPNVFHGQSMGELAAFARGVALP